MALSLHLRSRCAILAIAGSATLAPAQEPQGPLEPVLSPATFRDEGPADTALVISSERYDGPVPVVEQIADPLPDEFPRFEKDVATLDTVPEIFLGNPYFLGFAHNLYRPPLGERIDPQLVQRIVLSQVDPDLPSHTWAFVMIEGRNTAAKRDRLEAMGVKLLRYHPNNCYSARIPLERALELSELPIVHWVGYPRLSQKVHTNLRSGIEDGSLWGRIPIWINLYESDLGPTSQRVIEAMPEEVDPSGVIRIGDLSAAGYAWQTNSELLATLTRLGFENKRYYENIDAYEGTLPIESVAVIAALEKVQHVEWAPLPSAGHDRHVPQVGQDYERETVQVLTGTVGIADSGFNIGHWDLGIWGVGWSYWTGGCGSVWCDESGEGYHGSHTMGTIRAPGSRNNAIRAMSPYVGSQGGQQRMFAVKGYTYSAFQHYRNSYFDGTVTSPRPFLSSHSWRSGGCTGSPAAPAFWVGSESGARTTDDEVFNYNQLYVFCGGNEGNCNGGCGIAGSMGIPSVAKNALTIGAVWDDVTSEGDPGIATCFSSNGPCGDGRWKPNLVAPGCSTTSVDGSTSGSSSWYSSKCGCSMATPTTAGCLAGAAEKYNWNWSSLARAWAMATAVSWQDGAGSSLNRYGLGRLSAIKAQEGGGSYPWSRNWSSGTITSEIDTFDFTVFAGATRVIVVLTWDDPQASSGASSATVNDIDLWLDADPFTAGATGEWSSRTVAQTVEHIIVNNPAAGSYRVKVQPYNNSTTNLRWGAMAIQLFGDTTPTGSLSATVSDAYIQPGENITVDVSASTSSYIATNVWLDKLSHTGFTQTAAQTTLKDGQVLNTNFSDTLLGDIVDVGNSSRTATYTFNASTAIDAVRTLSWQARSDNWGTRNVTATVTVDGTPPPTVTNLRSTSHTLNAWSNSRTLTFAWSQAADNLSGLDGYGEFWSSTNPTGVGAIWDFGVGTSRTITVTSDYDNLYYGLRTVDRSGNWTGEITAGPWRIDTVLPSLPLNLRSTSHTVGAWSNDASVDFAWNAASDDRSGVDGYGEAWASSPGVPVNNGKDMEETTLTRTRTFTNGTWYYALKTVDNAGNWTTATTEVGPFRIDTAGPTAVVGLSSSTHTAGTWSQSNTVTLNWAVAADPLSGVAGYDTLIDSSPTTEPAGALDTPAGATTTTRSLANTATGHYFHIRARDNAGNWGPTAHFGPILIDNALPVGPSNLRSPSHAINTWSNVQVVQFAWNAASDAHSGVSGLAAVYDQLPGTEPGWPTNLPPTGTSTSRTLGSSTSGWYIHLRARDVAANWGTTQHLGPFLIDTRTPTGSVVIDGGNGTTTSLAVTLTLTAADAISGVDSIRLRNDGGSFSSWMPFAASMPWNLTNFGGSSGTGTRRVTMEVRDRAGNVQSVSDDIYYFVPVSYFGSSCAGSLGQPTFAVTGIPGLGRNVSFVPGNTAASASSLILGVSNTTWGAIALPIDLGFLHPSASGCFLNVSLDLTIYSGPPAPLNVAIPLDGSIIGIPLYYQWHLYGDPSGKLVVTTRGARVVASDV